MTPNLDPQCGGVASGIQSERPPQPPQSPSATAPRFLNETTRNTRASSTAAPRPSQGQRQRRQFENWIAGGSGEVGPCFTDRGLFGKCMSFKKCYPFFKLPQLSSQQTWVFGMFDTCTYFTSSGKQAYGVCCPEVALNPIFQIAADDEDDEKPLRFFNKPLRQFQSPAIPNDWPPPIPTHPPDHTIPPLPTHPPSYPQQTTPPSVQWPPKPQPQPQPPSWPPTSQPPSWPPASQPQPQPPSWPANWPPQYPTAVPPNWPPPLPTHPPAMSPVYPTLPSTTEKPAIVPVETGGGDSTPDYNSAQCGLKNGLEREEDRIVGGQNARPGEWPWIAALMNGGRQFCGGSLLDNQHVLTAAHCVAHMSSWDVAQLTVNLGDHNIKSSSDVRHIEKKVKRIVRHKGFDARTLYNDVAIITLDSPVTYSRNIRSICLPSGNKAYAGKTATVIGWGSLREMGPQPAILQKVNIPVWTNQECKEKYGPAAPGGIIDTMLCAGQTAQDSCSGDSGGPLMVEDGTWTQVGIVSWGIGCGKGQYPGVYTRVTHFMPWIKKNLKT
ncbi:unnamed protein product [Bemisia tabaci]|uniref:Phenoloxidase-activating factor 2 n=1 Tax=Bemisia tabaci TaxID=7038 RepID=A0A9P0EXX9_BEMTA|nr:unnamed protein product [Bemisia tabaci]